MKGKNKFMEDKKLNDAIAFVSDMITNLENDLDHEECVGHDKARTFFIKCDLDNYRNVLECLYKSMKSLKEE